MSSGPLGARTRPKARTWASRVLERDRHREGEREGETGWALEVAMRTHGLSGRPNLSPATLATGPRPHVSPGPTSVVPTPRAGSRPLVRARGSVLCSRCRGPRGPLLRISGPACYISMGSYWAYNWALFRSKKPQVVPWPHPSSLCNSQIYLFIYIFCGERRERGR